MTRLHIQLLAGAIVLSLAGCGSTGSSTPGGGATPQAVFENFKTATQAKDYQKASAQTTPESQDMLLGGIAVVMRMMAMFDPNQGAEVQKILDKHGVEKLDMNAPPDTKDPKAMMTRMVSGVKDKPACIGELMAWMEKNGNKKTDGGAMTFGPGPDADKFADATLEDVKIDGPSATGTIKSKKANDKMHDEAKFKKIGELWFIDFASMMPIGAPGGPMPNGDFVPTGPAGLPGGFTPPGQK
jgi:hypothetical protein